MRWSTRRPRGSSMAIRQWILSSPSTPPLAPGIRAVRAAGRWDVVVDCGNWEVPGVTSALVSRLVAGETQVIGPAVAPTGPLHDMPVGARTDTRSELAQRLHLLSPLLDP